jgi:excisionase family DNA binding protein
MKQEDLKLPSFLTLPEVAKLLRLKPRTIYNMVTQGRIPYRRAGRLLLFDQKEIEDWTKVKGEKR